MNVGLKIQNKNVFEYEICPSTINVTTNKLVALFHYFRTIILIEGNLLSNFSVEICLVILNHTFSEYQNPTHSIN